MSLTLPVIREPAEAAKQTRPPWVNFAVGAASALSGWMFVHPADLLKVRQQLAGEAGGPKTPLTKVAKDVVAKEGIRGLYGGLSAAVARQLSYGNMRLGFYETFKEMTYGTEEPTGVAKLALGLSAGGVAALLSNPIEVSLVRMQADGRLPKAEQRGYSSVFSALFRIGKEEGAKAYMAGVGPTVVRAMVVNMLQVGGYDIAKKEYSQLGISGVPLHLSSALTSGFVYSAATLPIDTAKTRMQNQVASASGELVYKSLPQTIGRIASKEGLRSLWNGFTPYFVRCGGHTVFMFLFREQYRKVANHYYPL